MKRSQLVYEISGEILYEPHKSEHILVEIVNSLNARKKEIEAKTVDDITETLKKIGLSVNTKIEINFDQGSILVTGIAVLDFLGKISGGVSFFEYLSRLINSTIKRNIKSADKHFHDNTKFSLQVDAVILPASNDDEHAEPSFFGVKPSSIILTITMLNIILFLGGTIYTGFKIDSIQERYDAANEKITKANDKYNEASRMLQSTQVVFQSKLAAIDTINKSLNAKKFEILNSLNLNEQTVSNSILSLNSKINNYSKNIESSLEKINAAEKTAITINNDLSTLQKNNIKFGLKDIWRYISDPLKWGILFTIAIMLALFATVLRNINKIKTKVRLS